MSLAQFQRAIAALVCEEDSLADYSTNPRAWLARQEVGGDTSPLADLDVGSLRRFHEIHTRDRAYFLEAVLPLTTGRLGPGWFRDYFRRHPYGFDDTLLEAERFVEYLSHSAEAGARALGEYELACLLLSEQAPFEVGTAEARPAGSRTALARGLALLPVSVHVPALVEDPQEAARPAAGIVLLRRDPGGITPAWIEGVPARVLLAQLRQDDVALAELLRTHEGYAAHAEILEQGVFR